MPHRHSRGTGSDDRIIEWVNENTETAEEAVHAIGARRDSGKPSKRQVQALIDSKYGEKAILAALGRGEEAVMHERERRNVFAAQKANIVLEPGQRFERVKVPDRHGKIHEQERVRDMKTGRFVKIQRRKS